MEIKISTKIKEVLKEMEVDIKYLEFRIPSEV